MSPWTFLGTVALIYLALRVVSTLLEYLTDPKRRWMEWRKRRVTWWRRRVRKDQFWWLEREGR